MKPMAEQIAGLVNEWLRENVHNYPLEDKDAEVNRLSQALAVYTMKIGYTQDDVESHIGSMGDYVEDYFEQVQDPELGFKD
jgi:hypothetical protein